MKRSKVLAAEIEAFERDAMPIFKRSNKKSGIIKYSDKHDSYFIQVGTSAYALHLFNIDETLLGSVVTFTHNSMNEVTSMDASK